MLSSITGGGVEPILEMEINEFISWCKAAEKIKCQHYL
jgi:hypothetical protein